MNRRRDTQRTIRSALITGVGIALLASGGPVVAGEAGRQLAQRGLESFEIEPNSRSLRKTLKQTREVQTVRFAQQFGLAYLPLMVIRQHRLIEKHVTAAGLGNVRIEWSRFPSGKAMNDALQTGLLDFASGGPTPLLKMWDRNAGAFGIKGVCALSTMPVYLNTVDPDVRTLADLSDSDRIALPRVKESLQAVILQMAAAREFGENGFNALDRLTVSMAHPEAMAAMLSGQSGITSHFASPPFQYQELDDSRVRTLVSSYDVLGGPATFTVLWTRTQFYYENPKTFRAIVAALAEAVDFINANPRGAADIYRQQSNVNLTISSIETILTDPLIEFTLTPANIMPLAEFMRRTGAIKRSPESRRDLFLAGDGITN